MYFASITSPLFSPVRQNTGDECCQTRDEVLKLSGTSNWGTIAGCLLSMGESGDKKQNQSSRQNPQY